MDRVPLPGGRSVRTPHTLNSGCGVEYCPETAKATVVMGQRQGSAVWNRSVGPRTRAVLSLVLSVALVVVGVTIAPPDGMAADSPTETWTWDTQADFETNASTTGEPVGLMGVSTTDAPGAAVLADDRLALVAVSAGHGHTVGLRSDGTAVAVGSNNYGQSNVSGWTDLVAVSAGSFHTVGLRSDGTAVAVGSNDYGQLDVSGWTDLVAVSAGTYHTVGLRSDGTAVAVGYNSGQINLSRWTDLVAVAAGFSQTVGLRSDGTAVAVGLSSQDQLIVSGWTDLVAVSVNEYHTVGLRSDGTAVAVGLNNQDQLNVSGWTDLVAVSAGANHTVGLRSDGTAVAVGYNNQGQLDVSGWTDLVAVSTDVNHTVGLRSDGTAVAVGYNGLGQLNVSSWTDLVAVSAGARQTVGLHSDGTAVLVGSNDFLLGQFDVSSWTDLVAVSAGTYHTVGLRSDGTAVAVGYNSHGQLNVSGWTDLVAVSAGTYHTVGLRSDGTAVAVGLSNQGQLDVSGWTDLVAVSAGDKHTVGLRSDGTAVAVGSDYYGKLDVSGWTDLVAVSAGYIHTVGLRSDGTAVAVGSDYYGYGQLDVSGWTDLVAVSAGNNHAVGLRSDGTAVAVGNNDYGQLDASGWTDLVAVSAGNNHTVGLRSDGTAVAVGENDYGQLDVSGWPHAVEPMLRTGAIGGEDSVGLRVRRDGTTPRTRHWTSLGARLLAWPAPGEAVKIAARVSDDGITWSEPLGRDGAPVDWTDGSGTYFGTAAGDNAWHGDLSRIPPKRFIDLEVRLSSSGVTSPIIHSLTLSALSGEVMATPIAGAGRVETAIEASKLGFPDGSEHVLVATARSFPDALGGSALAGALDAPILLTEPASLSSAVSTEIARLGATKVIVLGGTGAVSEGVFAALDALPGVTAERIFGANRYTTADAIAERTISEMGAAWDGTAFVATGESFPDALGASPIAAAKGWPIYLVHPNPANHDALVAIMEGDGVTSALILGGTGPVPASFEAKLNTAFTDTRVDRLAGNDRYTTAVTVATYGVTSAGLSWDGVAIATGEDFPDALSGGALQGASGSVMMLAYSGYLHTEVGAALTANAASIYEVRFLGGTGAVPQTIRSAVVQKLQ